MRLSVKENSLRVIKGAFQKSIIMLLCILLPFGSVSASEVYSSGEDISLKVEVKAVAQDNKEEDTPVMGVELKAVPVAALKAGEGGDLEYILTDKWKSFEIKEDVFNSSMTASESNKIAESLSQYIKDNDDVFEESSQTAITSSKGIADFGSLPLHGIYLVYQSGGNGKAADYTHISPFLAQVPLYVEGEGWHYNVVTQPKITEKVNQPEDPPKPPKKTTDKKTSGKVRSGDESDYALWAAVLAGAAVILIILGFLRKGKNGNK